jgi:hypothetical protein
LEFEIKNTTLGGGGGIRRERETERDGLRY